MLTLPTVSDLTYSLRQGQEHFRFLLLPNKIAWLRR